jgi:Carboxypeptidase regulatory-like domain/TonB dependent receptor
MRLIRRILSLVLGAGIVAPAVAAAQISTGQISGRVTDTSGAVLPGVAVTATHTETQTVRTTVTNEVGAFTLPNLPVGPYRLEASLQGFQTFVQSGITIQVNSNLVVDPSLRLGDVTETITVQARPSDIEVETRRMGVGTVVEQERILELPLNARQVTDLITLSGAAVQVPNSVIGNMVTGVNISVAGGGRWGVQYLLDGAINNNRWDATNMPLPFPDALQEFRINTSAQDAAVGRASGASVNAVTKAGTNQFHGNGFWFVRDTRFNARAGHAATKDKLQRNQPGFSVGGPIVENKLFFFTGYQSTVLDQTLSDTLSIVPTPAMLSGDWRAFNQCHNPAWRDADFVDGVVDPSRYSPAAVRLAARLPQPAGPRAQCGELIWGNHIDRHDKQTVTRVDYQHSNSHSFYGRYMATLHDQPVTFNEDNLLTATAVGSGFRDRAHSVILANNWVMNPTTVGATRFAYNAIRANKQGARFFNPEDVGIAQWTSVPNHFPVTVAGSFTFGWGPLALRTVDQNAYQVGHDVTLLRGTHQFAIGGSWSYDDVVSLAHSRGVGGISITANNTGNALGDFMLGRLTEMRQSMPSTNSPSQQYVGIYAQDTWRMTDRLTLNYGVRWEPFFPFVWQENPYGGIRVYNFDVEAFKAGRKSVVFPSAPAGFTYPSQNQEGTGPADFEGHSAVQKRLNKWSPRIGIGWDPTASGRTAVRASYGIAHDAVALEGLLNSNNVSPWAGDTIHRTGTLDNPWLGLAGGNPFPFDWQVTPKFLPGSVFIPFDPNLDTPFVQSWNGTVEQQLAGSWLVSASYIGTKSERLWNTTAINGAIFLTPQSHPSLFTGPDTCLLEGVTFTPCNSTTNINQRRELRLWAAQNNPALLADAALFANIDEFRSDSTANYHGLLLSGRGSIGAVNLDANYTLSRCMSDRVAPGIPNPNETFHRGRDRSYCQSDRRHYFNLAVVATAPQFQQRVWNAVASNWRFSALYRVNSGAPLTISSGVDRALSGLGGQTADQALDDVYQDRSGGLNTQYFNRAAFALPALGSYGNMDFFAVRGLAPWSLDVALSRIFSFGTQRIEARWEVFNPFNAAIPNDPATALSSPAFGRITTMRDPRIMQFALKYVF